MKIVLTALVAVALVVGVRAEEKAAAKTSWADFFKNLKSSLAQSAVAGERKTRRGGAGSVAAVRGEDQTKKDMADPDKPTLKGDARTQKAKREAGYDRELEQAVDLVAKGKPDEALKALQAFKEKHPKYRVEDVDKAVEGCQAMIAEKAGKPADGAEDKAAEKPAQ